MKTIIGILAMMMLLTHPAAAQHRKKERLSRDNHSRIEKKRKGTFESRKVQSRKQSRNDQFKRGGKQRGSAVQSRSESRNSAYKYSGHRKHHRSEMKMQNRSFKSNRYNSSRYQRKRSVKSHGHINQHHRKGRRVAVNYHYYRRAPQMRLIYRSAWHSFYKHHFRINHFHYNVNRPLRLVPGNTAKYYTGELASVFGRVYETYYDEINQEFHLSFGAPYPRHDFTVIVTGREALRMGRTSPGYFIGHDFVVSGLITLYDGKPEIIVRYRNQIKKY